MVSGRLGHDVTRAPVARTFLEQRVVLYRDGEGLPVALADRCPHRFAPLSQGKLVAGGLECPYHGLQFDRSGACVFNPHGNHAIPKRAFVRAYPLLERYGMVWIWMGDSALADPALLPDFSLIADHERFALVHGYLHLDTNYQLILDNLLDLSHAEFLHPLLGVPGSSQRMQFTMKQAGDTVYAYHSMPNEPITPLHKMMWKSSSTHGDRRAHMRWDAPANLLLDVGVTECGRPESEGPSLPSAHLLTPETERSTHYFWVNARDSMREEEFSQRVRAAFDAAFRTEDGPMIAACQERMESLDLVSLNPILLSTDAAATRARRVLQAKIEAERTAAEPLPV